MDDMIFLGDNIVLMGVRTGKSIKPINLFCVFNPSIYEKIPLSQNIRFASGLKFSMFDISTQNSAADFVDAIRKQQIGRIDLSTISNYNGQVEYWEIIYGKALTLQFSPKPITSKNPSSSRLNVLMYSYQQPYTGSVHPILSPIP
jgi:hypothetical protein